MTDRELLEKLLEKMTSLDNKVTNLDNKVTNLDNRVANLENEMSSIKVEVTSVKSLATKTQVILENDVAKKINVLFEGHQLHNEKLDELIEVTQDIQSSVLANEIVTKSNLRDIAALKKKAQ